LGFARACGFARERNQSFEWFAWSKLGAAYHNNCVLRSMKIGQADSNPGRNSVD
jgi:hypothetical protein